MWNPVRPQICEADRITVIPFKVCVCLWVRVHACGCMCLHTRACTLCMHAMCAYERVGMLTWRPEQNVGCLPLSLFTFSWSLTESGAH